MSIGIRARHRCDTLTLTFRRPVHSAAAQQTSPLTDPLADPESSFNDSTAGYNS
jgi:hypothetical protein